MKSRNLIIAMLAVISMASCRKEESMNPNTANVEPSTALRVSKLIPLTIVSDGKNITTYMYNSQMLPEKVKMPDGTVKTFKYDDLERVAELKIEKGGRIFIIRHQYDGDNRTSSVAEKLEINDIGEEVQVAKIEYGYDEQGRKVKEMEYDVNNSFEFTVWTYEYDGDGNIITASTIKPDGVELVRTFEDFDMRKGMLSNMQALTAEPGIFIQPHNARVESQLDKKGLTAISKFEFTYNSGGYPVRIVKFNEGSTEQIKVQYIVSK